MLNLEPCHPPKWASNGHLQTLAGHFLPSPKLHNKGKSFVIDTDDHDRLVGHLLEGDSSVVVYIFHGLAGSADSTYVHRTAQVALKMGHTVILGNHRGCGEGAGLAKGPYHSGRAEDLSSFIAYGKQRFPNKLHVAIGFSMSANALLLLMSGARGEVKADRAIAINGPIDIAAASMALKKGFNRVYDLDMYLGARKHAYQGNHPILKTTKLPYVSTLYHLDQIFTAPTGGFKDRQDFYSSCSSLGHLSQIDHPTVIITAEDDPFIPIESYRRARFSDSVIFHSEKVGGHMGYISHSKTKLGTYRWQDYAIDEALQFLI